MVNEITISERIKQKAIELGFDGVGFAKAEEISGFDNMLDVWLANNYHADMQYMARNREKRCNPTLLVEGAKSIISLIVSYYPEQVQAQNIPQIAKYAFGTDYHLVLKEKMQCLWNFIQTEYPELQGRMFVDSAPVSDKLWAVKAGLGWLGKNSCLINKELGSFIFICELIINIELDYNDPYISNLCGSCTKCVDACPTKAIVQPGVIDSRKCISYLTIENKLDSIPDSFVGKMNMRLFGCDICQDVCPWNKKPMVTNKHEFKPSDEWFTNNFNDWNNLEKKDFNRIFKFSALKRSKFEGIKRNLGALKSLE